MTEQKFIITEQYRSTRNGVISEFDVDWIISGGE
jgi:hypothetical protein